MEIIAQLHRQDTKKRKPTWRGHVTACNRSGKSQIKRQGLKIDLAATADIHAKIANIQDYKQLMVLAFAQPALL